METTYAPLDNLTVSLSGAYNNATYVSYVGRAGADRTHQCHEVRGPLRQAASRARRCGTPSSTSTTDVPLDDDFTGFTYLNQTFHSKVSVYNSYSRYGWQDAYGADQFRHRREDERRENIPCCSGPRISPTSATSSASGAASAITPAVGVLGDPRTFGVTFDVHVE